MSDKDSKSPVDEYQEIANRAIARMKEEDAKDAGPKENMGQLIKFPPRALEGSFKLEQNLGCELPVCVSNRRDCNKDFIEVTTDTGSIWSLERTARGKLPAPEHYPYWLWFLDRCHLAAEQGEHNSPRILLDPVEIFDLFGTPKGGTQYRNLDEAFERFSSMLIKKREAFFDGKRQYQGQANLGTLCYYVSWRAEPEKNQETFEFAKGWIAPGELLWTSIKSGYLKSVSLNPLRGLRYVGQRLYTYLSKHCPPSGEFAISPRKLLPKIPLYKPNKYLKRDLTPHHEDLAKQSFLDDVRFEGRGRDLLIVYRRT